MNCIVTRHSEASKYRDLRPSVEGSTKGKTRGEVDSDTQGKLYPTSEGKCIVITYHRTDCPKATVVDLHPWGSVKGFTCHPD